MPNGHALNYAVHEMADVLYVVADKLGGISSFSSNLIRHRTSNALRQRVLRCRSRDEPDSPVTESFGADIETRFEYRSTDNVHSRLRRLRKLIGSGDGALVSNDAIELSAFSAVPSERTIFQIVHDEYNFGLSKIYAPIIDVMIAHSRFYHEKLLQTFPDRVANIFYLPYGIGLAPNVRTHQAGPLHLIFLGRMHVNKGVHDLPIIDRLLGESGCEVSWTIIGDGPERGALEASWPSSGRVRYLRPRTNAEVMTLCAGGDVFVFPTRFEGFPVALLEAMSAGLVPVVSDLPSGIPEVVVESAGFRIAIGDCAAFASAIIQLSNNREALASMSKAARIQAEKFNIQDRAASYHELFARWREFYGSWSGPLKLNLGSRLDQPWLPNCIVSPLRMIASHKRSKHAVV